MVVSQGKIAAVGEVTVPTGAQEIAGEGRTLLPGLIRATRNIVAVWKRGVRVQRAPQPGATIPTRRAGVSPKPSEERLL